MFKKTKKEFRQECMKPCRWHYVGRYKNDHKFLCDLCGKMKNVKELL